jgi:hypothetical protein
MQEWNILATAQRWREGSLLRLLRKLGEFRHSGFRDVLIGQVVDVHAFLEALENLSKENPEKLRSLGQVVPVLRNFQFEAADFMERTKEAVFPYIGQLEN